MVHDIITNGFRILTPNYDYFILLYNSLKYLQINLLLTIQRILCKDMCSYISTVLIAHAYCKNVQFLKSKTYNEY